MPRHHPVTASTVIRFATKPSAVNPLGTKAHWPNCSRGTTIGHIMSVREGTNAAEHPAHLTPPRRGAHNGQSRSPATMKLLRRLGLTYIATDELTIRRLRHGRGFRYVAADGTPLRGEESQRLAALAVPPAYVDVLYAADPSAHIQAIGRRRRRTPAVPLSSRLAAGARDAQGAASCPSCGSAAAAASLVISASASRPAPSRLRLSSISSRAAPYVRAASNMRGCAARAARRRCSSRTSRSTARPFAS
jgi:hypothetical protein